MFAWDDQKHERCLRERGFGFDLAALIFDGETVETVDERRPSGEIRIKAIGEAAGFVLAVIYTDRGDTRRIISARQANRKERQQWLVLP